MECKKAAVIMGSDSDLDILKPGIELLRQFGVPFEVRIISAHRTPDQAYKFSSEARENGFGVIIAAAGRAAHLAGTIAANTTLPVIGIPVKSGPLNGLDALLSTVQMPSGIPVATVAIDSSANAALLAVEILSLNSRELADALARYRETLTEQVVNKDHFFSKELSNE